MTPPKPTTMRTALSYPVIGDVRHKLVAHYGINQTNGGRPYFSLTGQLHEPKSTGYYHTEPTMVGQLSDILTEHMPWLSLIASVHLSDALTGEPIHAEANSWYWFLAKKHTERGTDTVLPPAYRDLNPAQRVGAHLGCDPVLFEQVPCERSESARAAFSAVIDTLRPQWRRRAELVREQYLLELPSTHTSAQAGAAASPEKD